MFPLLEKGFCGQEHVFALIRIILTLLGKTVWQSKLFVFTNGEDGSNTGQNRFYRQKCACPLGKK